MSRLFQLDQKWENIYVRWLFLAKKNAWKDFMQLNTYMKNQRAVYFQSHYSNTQYFKLRYGIFLCL